MRPCLPRPQSPGIAPFINAMVTHLLGDQALLSHRTHLWHREGLLVHPVSTARTPCRQTYTTCPCSLRIHAAFCHQAILLHHRRQFPWASVRLQWGGSQRPIFLCRRCRGTRNFLPGVALAGIFQTRAMPAPTEVVQISSRDPVVDEYIFRFDRYPCDDLTRALFILYSCSLGFTSISVVLQRVQSIF